MVNKGEGVAFPPEGWEAPKMKTTLFTPEELEELRRYDAMVDASPMTHEDWKALELVEDLLFPERVAVRKANHARYLRRKEELAARGKAYREAYRDREAARKRAYYLANRERVAAQQKAYRKASRNKAPAGQ